MGKLIVLGLDGADFSIVDPLIAEGALPNLARMKESGSHARLLSTIPPMTAPAWRSIFTGTNPGKHGVYDFIKREGGLFRLTSARDNRVPYVWDLMEDLRFLAVNIPCSFPPSRSDNTVLVTGFATPPGACFTNPPGLTQEINALFPPSELRRKISEVDIGKDQVSPDELFRSLMDSLERTGRLHLHLMAGKPWDAAFIVFSETDHAQHFFLKEFLASESKADTRIAAVYKRIDAFLGKLMDEGYDIMVISDHGFREIRKVVYLNTYLMRKGLLKRKAEPIQKRLLRRLGFFRHSAIRYTPSRLFRFIHPVRYGFLLNFIFPSVTGGLSDIDAEGSDAYLMSHTSGGIFVKDKGRVDEVADLLKGLKDDEGNPAIRAILRKEEVYSGDALAEVPDLVILPQDGILIRETLTDEIAVDAAKTSEREGHHRIFGIFMSYGEGFLSKGRLEDLSVVDIASTLLPYFSYRNPAYFDGKQIPILKGRSGKGRTSTRAAISDLKKKL